jgi:hypothetical protein
MVNGDDGLSMRDPNGMDEATADYSRLGLTVRDFMKHDRTGFSFCSHWFDVPSGTAYLESWPKAFYRLLTRKVNLELVDAFMLEVRHHPRKVEMYDFIMKERFNGAGGAEN